jgi:hypothetical protein
MSASSIEELKSKWSIDSIWRLLGLPGEPRRDCCSPFREERKASFSIYEDGKRWKDHGSGEGGDIIDLIAAALKLKTADAITWLRERESGYSCSRLSLAPRISSQGKPAPRKRLPALRIGSEDELERLGKLRSLAIAGLQLAQDRGMLRFTTWATHPAWAITDGTSLAELRRLDGRPWDAYGPLPERKAHCVGILPGVKNRPVGIAAAEQFQSFLLVEGAPDALAAHDLIVRAGAINQMGVLAVLGGASRIDREAASLVSGHSVRIIPHADPAGRDAVQRWSSVLIEAGAKVDAYTLEGLTLPDGRAVKDLNDALEMDQDAVRNLAQEVLS